MLKSYLNSTLNNYFNVYSALNLPTKAAGYQSKTRFTWWENNSNMTVKFHQTASRTKFWKFSSLFSKDDYISMCLSIKWTIQEIFIYNWIRLFLLAVLLWFVTQGDGLSFKGKILSPDRHMSLSTKILFPNEKFAPLQKGAMEGRWKWMLPNFSLVKSVFKNMCRYYAYTWYFPITF